MSKKHFTPEEDAFLGYVRNMPASVGKRFLLTLIDRNGFEAFEDFWDRLQTAHESGREKLMVGLTDEEIYCLAKARYCTSRRHFLTKAAGIGLCAVSLEAARRSAMHVFEGMEESAATGEQSKAASHALDAAIDASVSVGSGVAGTALLMKQSNLPTREMIQHIVYSQNFTEIRELMQSLDRMLKPIDISLDETRPGVYR
jgi:hypothetical protein